MANDDSLAKNIIGEGEKFLRSLSPEDRIKVSKFQNVGEFLEFVKNRSDVLRPYSLWEEIKELNAPQLSPPSSSEEREEQPNQPEGGDSHRRTAHYHPSIIEEPEADEVSGSTKQTVVGQQTKDPTETEEIFVPAQEPEQRTVVTQQRTPPTVATQPRRISGYPNRRRGGLLNRTNQLAARARRARGGQRIASSAVNAVKTGRKLGSAIGIVTSLVSAIPLILIIVFVIIIGAVMTDPVGFAGSGIASLFSGSQSGSSDLTPTPVPPGPVPQCGSNPTDCLKNDFNIVVRGNVSQRKLFDLYSLFAQPSIASTYKGLLKNSGPTIVQYGSGPVNCSATVEANGDGTSTMTLKNFDSCNSTADRRDRIVHESGHVIRNGRMRLFQDFESKAYFPKDRNCYKTDFGFLPPFFIKTYDTGFAKQTGLNISGSNESMADSMAIYFDPRQPLMNYQSQCPVGYAWIKANIFGGYVFR